MPNGGDIMERDESEHTETLGVPLGYRSPSDLRRDAYYALAHDHAGDVRVWCPLMGCECVGRSCAAARIREAGIADYLREYTLVAVWECTAYPRAGRRVDAELYNPESE